MYKIAYKYTDEVIFYFDSVGNKYVASEGSLAWRLNNPGLIRCHSHFSRSYKSIGSCGRYAIFSNPEDGHQALIAWIQSKKYYNSSLKTLAEHYQPNAVDAFVHALSTLAEISPNVKVNSLNKQEFTRLVLSIEKWCGYQLKDGETFMLLPKIVAKIENGEAEDTYLISDNSVLTKKEAIEWIETHQLDGVIVNEKKNKVHLRSRPNHCIWNIKLYEAILPPSTGKIETLVRNVGEKKKGQCIWGFINGIDNTKEEAIKAATRISEAAGQENVLTMPNDTSFLCIKDGLVCFALKFLGDTSIIEWAAKFFRYLLSLSDQDNTHPPVIVFAHSQGAIISEHALELLSKKEREKLIIFTFGGGSFIAQGKCHPDSHNYASAADFVCSMGSPNLQYLALQKYFGNKEGKSIKEVIYHMSFYDAMLDLDSTDPEVMEAYIKQREKYYEKELSKIENITVLDPDPKWRHKFESSCYQNAVLGLIKKYQR
jgi:hypothetical protein